MFKNKNEYLAARKALLEKAEGLLNENKIEEYEVVEKEINDLDASYEKFAKAQANMSALKDTQPSGPVEFDEPGPGGEDEKKDTKAEYLNAWAKRMLGRRLDENEKKILDTVNARFVNDGGETFGANTAAEHALLVPDSVSNDIWREAGEMFPIFGDTSPTFVRGDITILKETDGGDDGQWYDEDDEVEGDDFAIGQINLTGHELAKAIPVSWKLKKMSIKAFIPYITTLLAEKMGAALAKAIVSGPGQPGTGDDFKPQPRGILTVLNAEDNKPQVVEYGDGGQGEAAVFSYETLTLALSKIKSAYKSGAVIYANNGTIWNTLANLKDTTGRPYFVADVTSGGVGRIFGLTVKEDDSVGGGVLIGNLKKGYAININEDITMYSQDHVRKRYTDYMSYAIVDGDVITTKAFAYIAKEAVEEG